MLCVLESLLTASSMRAFKQIAVLLRVGEAHQGGPLAQSCASVNSSKIKPGFSEEEEGVCPSSSPTGPSELCV